MNMNWKEVAQAALDGAEADTLGFPQSVGILTAAGFDGYAVDFRRSVRTYYLPEGDTFELKTQPTTVAVAVRFDAALVKDAIREAQSQAPGYTYKGFCNKVTGAGCAGYLVSLLGKRVLYYGRNGETHTEYFPGARPDAGQ